MFVKKALDHTIRDFVQFKCYSGNALLHFLNYVFLGSCNHWLFFTATICATLHEYPDRLPSHCVLHTEINSRVLSISRPPTPDRHAKHPRARDRPQSIALVSLYPEIPAKFAIRGSLESRRKFYAPRNRSGR